MKREYNKEYKISYSEVDQNLKLGIYASLNLAQNTVTDYFESFGGDNIVLKSKDNAIWVVSKAKVHFNRFPNWRDCIKARSYTTKIKPIRVEIETVFKDKDDEVLFVATQETCAIDLETRKVRKINTVSYPDNMEVEQSLLQNRYLRLDDEFTEDDLAIEQKVYSQDIDYSMHVNNTIYVRYIMNALSCDFLNKNKITDFEIQYINESIEGDILKIYKKEQNNNITFLIKNQEKVIIKANLTFVNNDEMCI